MNKNTVRFPNETSRETYVRIELRNQEPTLYTKTKKRRATRDARNEPLDLLNTSETVNYHLETNVTSASMAGYLRNLLPDGESFNEVICSTLQLVHRVEVVF